MDSHSQEYLKLVHFARWKKFCLVQKLKKLKITVALNYARRKTMIKTFSLLRNRTTRSKEILKMCCELTKMAHSMNAFLQLPTPLKSSTMRLIFAVHHDRIRTMRKYFHKFLLYHRTFNIK